MRIVFATKNEGKVREISEMMEGTGIEMVSLNHFAALPEIVEDGATYLENALKKARIVSEFLGETVLADDSGLQVDALQGEPGVYSARYAGEGATDEENNAKLLAKLKEVPAEKRTASFFAPWFYTGPGASSIHLKPNGGAGSLMRAGARTVSVMIRFSWIQTSTGRRRNCLRRLKTRSATAARRLQSSKPGWRPAGPYKKTGRSAAW